VTHCPSAPSKCVLVSFPVPIVCRCRASERRRGRIGDPLEPLIAQALICICSHSLSSSQSWYGERALVEEIKRDGPLPCATLTKWTLKILMRPISSPKCTDAGQGCMSLPLSPGIPVSMDPGAARCIKVLLHGFHTFHCWFCGQRKSPIAKVLGWAWSSLFCWQRYSTLLSKSIL
jgi:hypothetical protein